jgi:IS5 family transposase
LRYVPGPRTPSLYDDAVGSSYIPADHRLRKINAVVDFSFIHKLVKETYCPDNGAPACSPEVLVRLMFLQFEYGLSDRGVMERAQTDHAFRWFLGLDWNDKLPHHTILTGFRQRLGFVADSVAEGEDYAPGYQEAYRELFKGVLAQAQERGLVLNERALLDSYNIQADINVPTFRRLLERIVTPALASLGGGEKTEFLRSEYAALLARKSYDLPAAERRQVRGEWLALAELVAEQLEAVAEPQRSEQQAKSLGLLNLALLRAENHGKQNIRKDDLLSDVDPAARWATKKRGKQVVAGYKQQLMVDEGHGIVTGVALTPGNTDDSQMLQTLVEQHEANVGGNAAEVVTDSKYHGRRNRKCLKQKGIVDHIAAPATKGSKQGQFSTCRLIVEFDEQGKPKRVVCPAMQEALNPRYKEATDSYIFYFTKAQCEGCTLREQCTKQKRGRSWSVDANHQLAQEARAEQQSPAAQAAQIARLGVERNFAHQKQKGGERARYRGLKKNEGSSFVTAAFLNIKRMTAELWAQTQKTGGPKLDSKGRLTVETTAPNPGQHWAVNGMSGVNCV